KYDNLGKAGLGQFAAFKNGKTTPFSRMKSMMLMEHELCFFNKIMRRIAGRMTHIELKELDRLQRYIDSAYFPLEGKESPDVEALHEISMHRWMSEYSDEIRNTILIPMLMTTFESDFKKMSARYGVSQIKKSFDIARKGGHLILGGPFAVTQDIIRHLREKNSQIEFLAEVRAIEESGRGFDVVYNISERFAEEKAGDKEVWGKILKMVKPTKERFKYVVLALQLPAATKITGKEFGIEYLNTKALYTQGNTVKGSELIFGPDSKSNFRVMYALLTTRDQSIYPIDPKTNVKNIEDLFKKKEYRMLYVEDILMAMPRILPKQEFPSLEYKTKNIFLCGDFHKYPCIDTAVWTGFNVAQKIINAEK
ncbi:MAG: hypothetical protein KAT35_02960, partial [Candidatus Aenigmarchaeota archaeon]|nr:hypothetical protein [Candidatus Aenigmarchaeota archaeon]